MSDTHELKCDPQPFQAVSNGFKTFEIRFDDRGFKLGDTLVLREHERPAKGDGTPDQGVYTGRFLECDVTHIVRAPKYGLQGKWCVMAIKVRR